MKLARNLVAVVLGLSLLSSCGPDSGSGRYGQDNLPDSGLWLCKLDFEYYAPNRTVDFFMGYGDGRNFVKDELTRTCLSSSTVRMEGCSVPARNDQFRCIHESEIQAPAEQSGFWDCRLDFYYDDGAGSSRHDLIASGAMNRRDGIADVYGKCRATFRERQNGCANAILNGQLRCSVRTN